MINKVWDEITYPFPNFNRWSLGMDKWIHPTLDNGCNYLSMLGLKLNHARKRSPQKQITAHLTWYFGVYLGIGWYINAVFWGRISQFQCIVTVEAPWFVTHIPTSAFKTLIRLHKFRITSARIDLLTAVADIMKCLSSSVSQSQSSVPKRLRGVLPPYQLLLPSHRDFFHSANKASALVQRPSELTPRTL